MNQDPEIRRAVQRTVGIAALRRLRRLVDAEQALEADKRRWARRLTLFLLVAGILAVAWIVIR
jgi:ferric-dicitrate binding protein FerR (iron transport regulator)